MIKNRIRVLRNKLKKLKIDGYIVPKNDEFFSEYASIDRLKVVSNFSGSAGIAVVLKKKNYLFVDGRYTLQAQKESGKEFKIIAIHKILPHKILKNLRLGFDPSLHTKKQLKVYFGKTSILKAVSNNLIDEIQQKKTIQKKKFFSLNSKVVGESYKSKINKIRFILKSNKADYLFISAPENVAWILNIRGSDNPNSPIPNCRLLLSENKKIHLISDFNKAKNLIKEKKIHKSQIVDPGKIVNFFQSLKQGKIIIDKKTCSIFNEKLITKKLKIIKKDDPIYLLKSIKRKNEINNMIQAHIHDGAALTKFLYWIKFRNKKKISEFDAQNKLESFRKKNSKYLSPSFDTIAGAGKNGAIVHYRATKKNAKIIQKSDIFLCDSGGQYRYGTTDVTRTICFKKPNKSIKNIFTKVLKGHIAVSSCNLDTHYNGKLIDILARRNLKISGLDYKHGTGHGVGFFSNVHEGPQGISKFNTIKIREGMILSNEPGYYKENQFGIRIENLVYVKKIKKKLLFKNLTYAPIDIDLIDFSILSKKEKNYLFKYHMETYLNLSKYLNHKEKKWLQKLI